jgi:regulator of replication initiation timing
MYTLEEGLMISVDEGGVIVEVKKEGEEVEEVEAGYDKEMEKDEMMEPKEEMKEPKKVVKSKTEMEESYFSKIEARLSAIESSNDELKLENVKLSEENEELRKQLAESPANHTKFNPESEAKRDFQFKIGSKRSETIQDRVFNSLF